MDKKLDTKDLIEMLQMELKPLSGKALKKAERARVCLRLGTDYRDYDELQVDGIEMKSHNGKMICFIDLTEKDNDVLAGALETFETSKQQLIELRDEVERKTNGLRDLVGQLESDLEQVRGTFDEMEGEIDNVEEAANSIANLHSDMETGFGH